MQINLPDDVEALIRERAAAAGFSGQIAAYVAHLVEADSTEDFGAPKHLSAKDDLNAKIDEGFDSGPASAMAKSDWQELHNRIDGRQPNS